MGNNCPPAYLHDRMGDCWNQWWKFEYCTRKMSNSFISNI